jgi:putative transposase
VLLEGPAEAGPDAPWHETCSALRMRFRRSIRLKTFDYLGQYRYAFTICTAGRRVVFTSLDVVEPLLSQFQQCSEREDVGIAAYCFMPDHLHLLVVGLAPASDVLQFVNRAKQKTGYWYARRCGQRLWQRYSWDRILRSEEDTMTAARYILANPVRAGLTERAADYLFSGSVMFSRQAVFETFHMGPRAG